MIPLIGGILTAVGIGILSYAVGLYDPRLRWVLCGVWTLSIGLLIMVSATRIRRNKGQ